MFCPGWVGGGGEGRYLRNSMPWQHCPSPPPRFQLEVLSPEPRPLHLFHDLVTDGEAGVMRSAANRKVGHHRQKSRREVQSPDGTLKVTSITKFCLENV